LGQQLAHREPNIRKTTFSSEHCSLHTILRKSLLSPVFLAVNPFPGTGEYEESLGLIGYLCFVCNVWHPLQFLVSYCRADPRGFSVYLRNLEVAGKKVKNRNNMSLPPPPPATGVSRPERESWNTGEKEHQTQAKDYTFLQVTTVLTPAGGGGGTPYTMRLRPIGVPFSGFRYING